MTVPINGPWEDQQLTEFLRTQLFPIRLASVGKDGFPRVLSLWYFYADGTLRARNGNGTGSSKQCLTAGPMPQVCVSRCQLLLTILILIDAPIAPVARLARLARDGCTCFS